jgi:hypothetical protein
MEHSVIYSVTAEHEAENSDIKIGHNSGVSHFVKRKVDALYSDDTIKPEKIGSYWKTQVSAGT